MKKVLLALLAFFIITGCNSPRNENTSKYQTDLKEGVPAVDFLFRDMDNIPFRLSEKKGKVVLIYFWRMKCEGCKKELKAIDTLYRKYKDRDFIAVAVGADSMHSASLYDVYKFFDAEKFSFIKLRDEDGFVAEAYRVMRAPEAYLIDKKGEIALIKKGPYDWTSAEAAGLVERLLSENGK